MDNHREDRRRLFRLARGAVIGLAIALLVFCLVGLWRFPGYAARHLDAYTPNGNWTPVQVQAAVRQLGWRPMALPYLLLGRDLFSLLLNGAFAVILLRRRSPDWFGLYFTLVIILTAPLSGYILQPTVEVLPPLHYYGDIVGAVGWQLFFILFFFFPDGRPVPRWTRWLAAAWLLSMPFTLIFNTSTSPLVSSLAFGFVAAALLSQIYRFFRRSDALQRQQTKWLVFGLAIGLVYVLGVAPFTFRAPDPPDLGRSLLFAYTNLVIFSMVFWIVPLAITIAILRYRLWDVDLIIRRTLVYGALTAALALVYFGSVVVFQQVFRLATGQNSPAAVVLSTLAIAALFTPLRSRIQQAIDRRFFRQRYDSEQALARFSSHTRDEVDMDQLANHLSAAVQDTLHPQTISLWLIRKS